MAFASFDVTSRRCRLTTCTASTAHPSDTSPILRVALGSHNGVAWMTYSAYLVLIPQIPGV